jgi:hypothetical protein
MLRSVQDLQGVVVEGVDGQIGRARDFYFDDEAWAIRFLVVDTGAWLEGRKVLIPQIAIGRPDRSGRVLPVSVTREQVRNGPDAAKPGSQDDPHLRSCDALVRYHVDATDGGIGHVEGLIVDDDSWVIRYLVVSTSGWWLGHQVLIAPEWIEDIDWLEATVSVDLSRQAVKHAPAYDPDALPDREQEIHIYQHYARPGYWGDGEKRETEMSRGSR